LWSLDHFAVLLPNQFPNRSFTNETCGKEQTCIVHRDPDPEPQKFFRIMICQILFRAYPSDTMRILHPCAQPARRWAGDSPKAYHTASSQPRITSPSLYLEGSHHVVYQDQPEALASFSKTTDLRNRHYLASFCRRSLGLGFVGWRGGN
jgi:hypothetical protein